MSKPSTSVGKTDPQHPEEHEDYEIETRINLASTSSPEEQNFNEPSTVSRYDGSDSPRSSTIIGKDGGEARKAVKLSNGDFFDVKNCCASRQERSHRCSLREPK